MNARVALEIMRDRILRDFGQLDPETGKLVVVGLKRAQVAGKHRLAPAREQAGDAHQQLDVVALDIPGTTPHRLGIGKRRRVDEYQIELPALTTSIDDPRHDVRAHELMLSAALSSRSRASHRQARLRTETR